MKSILKGFDNEHLKSNKQYKTKRGILPLNFLTGQTILKHAIHATVAYKPKVKI